MPLTFPNTKVGKVISNVTLESVGTIHYTAVQKKLYMLQYVKVQYFKCYFSPGVGK